MRGPKVVLILAVALAGRAVVAGELETVRRRAPAACSVVSTARLEVVGAAFPTLPAPYVSIELVDVLTRQCGGPSQEALAKTSARRTLTVAQSRALGEALIAFADDPTSTTTILSLVY